MATIRAAIQIYDQMSRPLQAMSRGVNTLINAMETAQGTFDTGLILQFFSRCGKILLKLRRDLIRWNSRSYKPILPRIALMTAFKKVLIAPVDCFSKSKILP